MSNAASYFVQLDERAGLMSKTSIMVEDEFNVQREHNVEDEHQRPRRFSCPR